VLTNQSDLVTKLLLGGASANTVDRNGNTSFHLAVRLPSTDCLQCLITHTSRPLINTLSYDGLTVLHSAVDRGHTDAVQLLLSSRLPVNVNAADGKTGRTPLHYAVERNSLRIAALLLEHGADTAAETYSGCTPMDVAFSMRNGGSDMSQLLDSFTPTSDYTVLNRNYAALIPRSGIQIKLANG
jgi:ankyrin repeat protein